MTKNRSMRIAVLVLALALITCCFVGTTFAKYTSTATGSATLTVAKWSFDGVDLDANTVEFTLSDIYEVDTTDADDEVRANMIAPGTEFSATVEIVNNSDVDAVLAITPDFAAVDFLTITYEINGVEKQVGDLANIALDMDATATVTFNFVWPFFEDADTDADDTEIGIAAATAATKSIGVTATITQID